MTELLGRTFSSHFVFPVLGHLDPAPSESLTNMWSHWLPLEALQTFKDGKILLYCKTKNLHTNLWNTGNNDHLLKIKKFKTEDCLVWYFIILLATCNPSSAFSPLSQAMSVLRRSLYIYIKICNIFRSQSFTSS